MAILDNTLAIPGFQASTPASYFRNVARGAARLEGLAADSSDLADMTTKMNAEAFYAANLYRQMSGQPPLPANLAPSVNVGLDKNTQMIAVMGFGALLLYGLYKRKAG